MAGTFVTYNKVRPGAYFNFKSEPRPSAALGVRGIVAVPVELPWGATGTVVKLTAGELSNGKSVPIVGVSAFDDASLPLREAFKGAYTALVYRLNIGGAKATATVTADVTATAKYTGELGNKLSVKVAAAGGAFEVTTLLDGQVKDRQNIASVATFVPNDWVELSGTGTLAINPGIALTGGTNGTISATAWTDFMAALENQQWNTVAFPTVTANLPETVTSWVRELREVQGKRVQAVVVDYTDADYDGIISIKQGYKIGDVSVTPAIATAFVAGVTAGAQLDESNTYRVIPGATEIINPLKNDEIEAALLSGQMVFARKQNGEIAIEQDINTYHNFTQDKNRYFCKNRVLRTVDDLATQMQITFENKYIGKIDNNDFGRNALRGEFVTLFRMAQDIGAIRDFEAEHIEIMEGPQIEDVICNYEIWPVDAMERLYGTLTLH